MGGVFDLEPFSLRELEYLVRYYIWIHDPDKAYVAARTLAHWKVKISCQDMR